MLESGVLNFLSPESESAYLDVMLILQFGKPKITFNKCTQTAVGAELTYT